MTTAPIPFISIFAKVIQKHVTPCHQLTLKMYTNITTNFLEHYQFCDRGYYTNYEFPEENLSTQDTWIRLEDEKPKKWIIKHYQK
jgi:hypothetical protein